MPARLDNDAIHHQAREVVATAYGSAGSTAVFSENPFERRLRDIHAGAQRGQGRPIDFGTVVQVLRPSPAGQDVLLASERSYYRCKTPVRGAIA